MTVLTKEEHPGEPTARANEQQEVKDIEQGTIAGVVEVTSDGGESQSPPPSAIEISASQVVGGEENAHGENAREEAGNDDDEEDDPLTIHWKKSPFAVGRVKIKWSDEINGCGSRTAETTLEEEIWNANNFHLKICGLVFGKLLHAKRIGNMAVLFQISGKRDAPHLVWVAGPFWFVTMFVTVPLIVGISLLVYYRYLPNKVNWIQILWGVCTGLLLFSLAMVSSSNPGILPRHLEPPTTTSVEEQSWIWNDQARTFRPPSAKYDPLTAVVVEEFDHVCPWTGTAIGKGNMTWFRRFVSMVAVCLLLDVVIVTF